MQLLQVGLVPTGPVGWLLGVGLTQNLENLLQPLLVNDVTHAHEIEVRGWHPHDEIVLTDDPKNEVELLLTLDGARLEILDHRSPVIGIDNRFTDIESHVCNPFHR